MVGNLRNISLVYGFPLEDSLCKIQKGSSSDQKIGIIVPSMSKSSSPISHPGSPSCEIAKNRTCIDTDVISSSTGFPATTQEISFLPDMALSGLTRYRGSNFQSRPIFETIKFKLVNSFWGKKGHFLEKPLNSYQKFPWFLPLPDISTSG